MLTLQIFKQEFAPHNPSDGMSEMMFIDRKPCLPHEHIVSMNNG